MSTSVGDADNMIVQKPLESVSNEKPTFAMSDDTDVLVLFWFYHFDEEMGDTFFLFEASKRSNT